MRNKQKLTEELVQQLDTDLGITVKQAMHTWWFNLRSTGGMRLTSTGYHNFCEELDLEHYSFNIDDPTDFNQRMILAMDRKLQTPYYIHAVKGIPKKSYFLEVRKQLWLTCTVILKSILTTIPRSVIL